jgi:hypothetical protein
MDCNRVLDTSCCPDWDTFDPVDQEMATEMAWETLRSLSGYRIGNCPVTLRPCREGCGAVGTYQVWPVGSAVGWMSPTVTDGSWFNIACDCRGENCSCTAICEIRLPGEVASVEQVTEDGVTLDDEAYRVDNGNRLVRLDDACWPLCQDMTKPLTEVDTLGVTFIPGVALTPWMSRSAGALACEFAKACGSGSGACRLPPNVTRVVRQGVSLDLAQNPFPGGYTGLREVDTLLARYNPNRLQAPSVVYSPDIHRGRVTSWP